MTYKIIQRVAGISLLFILAACQVVPGDKTEAVIAVDVPAPQIPAIQSEKPQPAPASRNEPLQQEPLITNLWDRIGAGLSLNESYDHPSVDSELEWYINNQEYFDRIATRATPFLFWIVEEVERRELPLELVLLPVVESAYDPLAYSSEHAAGLWQFIGSTANSFGLQRDWWYDGRQDPLASTRAALDYLEMLHNQFENDWLLALAAYNTGEGNIRRAIRRNTRAQKSTEFWDLKLPNETRGHVPRILAIAKLIANASQFGVDLPVVPNEPYLEVVELDFQIDLDRAATAANLQPGILQTLNPGYLQWATHPDSPQTLIVPIKNANAFRNSIAAIPTSQRVTWDRYEIRSGDTLGRIARLFKTRVDILQEVNNLAGSNIVAGRSLLIPRSSNLDTANFPVASIPDNDQAETAPTSYRIRRGDNLWSIARRFGLRSTEIARRNNIAVNSLLHPGQVLSLQTATYVASLDVDSPASSGAVSYQIVKGDSLARIAARFGVSVADLVSWNNLEPGALIFPGQELALYSTPKTDLR